MSKPYKLGVTVGRFQTLHLGHIDMIEKAVELCDRVGIFVGSSQESRTEKNPFSYEEREEMLKILFGDKVEVYPLPDAGLGNNSLWGEYVINNVKEKMGGVPDLSVSGKESRRTSWLDCPAGEKIAELFVPKIIEISATEMRSYLIDGNRKSWEGFTDKRLHDKFDEMRKIVLFSKDNIITQSI